MVSRKELWLPSYLSPGPTAEGGQWWAHPRGTLATEAGPIPRPPSVWSSAVLRVGMWG